MFSLPVVTWIGNAAAVLRGQWGAVSQHARDVACRREAMDQQARRVEQAVAGEQAGGPSREELLAEHQRLREDNQTLWALLRIGKTNAILPAACGRIPPAAGGDGP